MIHQPHFLPWPGYLARCLATDVFVMLDNVRFNKNLYQQRTKYIDKQGRKRWLSLPVVASTKGKAISEVRIANIHFRKWRRGIEHAYMHAPNFDHTWHDICNLVKENQPSLLNVNRNTLQYFFDIMCATNKATVPTVLLASSIFTSEDRTQRLIDICSDQNITHLIMGRYAVSSHDCRRIQEFGISLVQHVYAGPLAKSPVPGVSVLHYLFQFGRDYLVEWMLSDWKLIACNLD